MEKSILKKKLIETLNKLFPNMEVDADVFEYVNLIDDLGIDSINFVKLVITLEDASRDGGFGDKVAAFYGDKDMKVKVYAFEKYYYDEYDEEKLLKINRMTNDDIISDISL